MPQGHLFQLRPSLPRFPAPLKLRLRRLEGPPNSNEVARGRIRQFESYHPSQAVRSPLGNCDRYGPRSQHTARLRCPPGASILQSRVSIEIWAPDPLAPSGARRSTSRALRSRRIAGFTPSALAVFTAWHPLISCNLALADGDRMQFDQLTRREFITLLGGAAAAWPVAASAQQSERTRRIGVLLPAAPEDAEFQSWVGAFLQGLAQSGWITGRNISIETRWTKFNTEDTRKYAAELVALGPDVIVATGTSTLGPLLRLTRTVPIVFPLAADPVAAGLVQSLARPGGNATGFMSFEIGVSAKWLELLKEVAPGLKRAAVLRTLATAAGPGQFGVIQAVASSLGVELHPIDTGDAGEIGALSLYSPVSRTAA
jgi:hypothetical protein